MRLVRQETENGCFAACIAMILGIAFNLSASFAIADLNADGSIQSTEICNVLSEQGISS